MGLAARLVVSVAGLAWAGAVWPAESPYAECVAGGDSRTLKLDVSVEPTIVVPTRSQEREPSSPHVSTIRVTLTNPGTSDLRLTFPDACFLGYRLETMEGEAVAGEEGRVCAARLVELRLAAGARETREFPWTARAWNGAYTPLSAGRYRILGTLAKRYCGRDGQEEPAIRTPPVIVEVRPAN